MESKIILNLEKQKRIKIEVDSSYINAILRVPTDATEEEINTIAFDFILDNISATWEEIEEEYED